MNDLTIVMAGLGRNPFRLLLTTLVAFIGFALFAVVAGIFLGLTASSSAPSQRLITADPLGFTRPLPISHLQPLRRIEGVGAVSPVAIFAGYQGERTNQLMTLAVDGETWASLYPELIITEGSLQAFVSDRAGLLVGQDLARRMGWQVGEAVSMNSALWRRSDGDPVWGFTVRAIFQDDSSPTASQYAALHYAYLDDGSLAATTGVNWFVLSTQQGADPSAVAQAADGAFAGSLSATATRTEDAFNAAFLRQFGDVALVTVLVVATAMTSLLLIVASAVAMNVRERWSELAALRAIGFSKSRVLRMVVFEGIALTGLGGAAGVFVASLLLLALSQLFNGGIDMASYLPMIAAMGVVLACALGGLASVGPAIQATRISVSAAFRKG